MILSIFQVQAKAQQFPIPSGEIPLSLDAPEETDSLPSELAINKPTTTGDYSIQAFDQFQQQILHQFGMDYKQIPLAIKAQYFEDEIWRFHISPEHQVHQQIILPDQPGEFPTYMYGADCSTWNGALLAALSYKYAVTKDQVTKNRIVELLQGLHFFHTITTYPGLYARCVIRSDVPIEKCKRKFVSPEGVVYHYRTDPAKGTYNQIIMGYTTCMMFVAPDLPPEIVSMIREDMGAMIWHLIKHDYQIVEASRAKTPYGDLKPLIGSRSVPFNAQLAYMMIAAGRHFPPPNPEVEQLILKEFKRLRMDHHVYYEDPAKYLIVPQRVGNNPLVKGMNDRNHLLNAAFMGIMLELYYHQSTGNPADTEFIYQMGQTIQFTMQKIAIEKNALCNVMWLGLLRNPDIFRVLIPPEQAHQVRSTMLGLHLDAVEQLHRFKLDRFTYVGHRIMVDRPTWVDERIAKDCYYWKSDPQEAWVTTGIRSNAHTCSTDYLYAYWLARYFQLENLN
jgi:hypothetical protein